MKILIAPDSFKTTLSSGDVIDIIKSELFRIDSSIETDSIIMSDGGEGFLDCINSVFNYETIYFDTFNSQNKLISVPILYNTKSRAGFIESAKIIGYVKSKKDDYSVRNRSTKGLGEIIKQIYEKFPDFVWYLGLGGTSTVDGGKDAASHLGIRFLNSMNESLPHGGYSLKTLKKIEITNESRKYKMLNLILVCDVNNPLIGKRGAVECFGPQKGIREDLVIFKSGFLNLANRLGDLLPEGFKDKQGYGSAGGIPATFETIFNWKSIKSLDFIKNILPLENKIKNCDLVITGEGSFDSQSLNGKVVGNIIYLAEKMQKPVLVIAGTVSPQLPEIKNVTSIATLPYGDLPKSQSHAVYLLKKSLSKNLKLTKHCTFGTYTLKPIAVNISLSSFSSSISSNFSKIVLFAFDIAFNSIFAISGKTALKSSKDA